MHQCAEQLCQNSNPVDQATTKDTNRRSRDETRVVEVFARRLDRRFRRPESRRRMRRFLGGLMAGLPRVNCWTLAEHVGEDSPGPMQHFVSAAKWDDDDVLDFLAVGAVGSGQAPVPSCPGWTVTDLLAQSAASDVEIC